MSVSDLFRQQAWLLAELGKFEEAAVAQQMAEWVDSEEEKKCRLSISETVRYQHINTRTGVGG